jgi:hypothetical protein
VAWVFVGAIIGLTLVLMAIGKGPMPLRVVGYDISLDGKAPAEDQMDALTTAIAQANPMVLALQGTSDDLTKKLPLKLEVKEENVVSEGSSAILSKYTLEKPEGEGTALIRYGKEGKFGVVNVDLSEAGSDGKLQEAVELAKTQFGEAPHAIFALVNGVPPASPAGYVNAPIAIAGKEEVSSHWHAFVPEAIEDNLKECYLPVDNETIQKYSDRLPLVARFVFHKEDFE